MKAGDIYSPRKIRLVDVDDQELTPGGQGEILFEPELACLCGSDLLYFEGDYPEYPPSVGQSLHEMIGRVVDTNGSRFSVGDRVLCVPVEHYGFFDRYTVDENRAIPVLDCPSDDEALMAQPLGTVICALGKLPSVAGQNVVVYGQGPMGQLFNVALRNVGARRIIGVDLLGDRLSVSPQMGATHTVNASEQEVEAAVRDITRGEMADVVVECVGHREQVLNQCIPLARDFGKILFFGVPPEHIDQIEFKKLFWKNLSIITTVGPTFDGDFALAMQWIHEERLSVTPIITHRYPVAQIQEAFDLFSQRQDGAIKVLLDF